MIEEINKILRETAFPNKQCNPFFILCMLLSFLSVGASTANTISGINVDFSQEQSEERAESNPILSSMMFLMIGLMLPYIIYFGLMMYKKSQRKSRLITFVREWHEMKSNGVFISLGGGGTVRGVVLGSETGGTYENFYMATWDPKSLLVRGYLHVFVNYQERASWCQQNCIPFIPPVPTHQQTMEQQIAQQGQVPAVPPGFQIPAGYALVPQNQQPPPEFQVPAGYALVPQSQDLPPNYYQASKM